MQSHLEAALLGQPGDSNVASNIEDDEKDFQEDDADDDFIDEVLFFSAYVCTSITCFSHLHFTLFICMYLPESLIRNIIIINAKVLHQLQLLAR